MIDVLFDVLVRVVSVLCAFTAVYDFAIGDSVTAICRILFALYLLEMSK